MVGGLLVSQALTLFTTPVIYLYLDGLSDAVLGWFPSRRAPKSERDEEHDGLVLPAPGE